MASLIKQCLNVNEIDSQYKDQHKASSCDCGYYSNDPKVNNCFFNFESIDIAKGSVINSAVLQLAQISGGYLRSESIQVILCSGDWAAFTWNNQPQQESACGNITASLPGDGAGTRSFVITPLIQWLVNKGSGDHIFKLQRNPNTASGSDDAKRFSTTPANHQLVIDYTPATNPTTPSYINVLPESALMGGLLNVSWDGSQNMGSQAVFSSSLLQISINGEEYHEIYTGPDFSTTVNMPDIPGGSIKLKACVYNNYGYPSGWVTSGSIQCLGASTINSVSDFAADADTVSFSLNANVYKETFTHNISLIDASTGNLITDGSTSLSWTGLSNGSNTKQLSPEQKAVLLNYMASVKTLGVKAAVTTYNSGVQVGSTQTTAVFNATTKEENSAPIGVLLSYWDGNSATAAVTGDNQWLIEDLSDLYVTADTASARNGASIVSYTVSIANKTVTSPYPGTFCPGKISQTGALACTLTVKDSRGYTATDIKTINAAAYTGIQITTSDSSCSRNGYGDIATTATLTISGRLSEVIINGVNKNAFSTVQYRYKPSSAEDIESNYSIWKTETASSLSDTEFSLTDTALKGDQGINGFTAASSYTIQVRASDRVSDALGTGYYVAYYTLPRAIPLLTFGNGIVGINNPQPNKALDVKGDAAVSGNLNAPNIIYAPAANTDSYIPQWNGSNGRTLKDGLALDTDGTLSSSNDAKIASQKAVKTYADTKIAASCLDTDGAMAANSDSKIASQKAVKTYADARLPAGTMALWPAAAAPSGWLFCNGSAVSRTTYQALYGVIGTTYGVGDGSTTFNLPNLKSRVPAGYDQNDSNFNTLGKTGGEGTHVLTLAETPAHTHDLQWNDSSHKVVSLSTNNGGGTTSSSGYYTGYSSGSVYTNSLIAVSQGGGAAHNNLQPYIVLNYIIKC